MKDSKLNELFTGNIITPLKGFCATVENDCNMTKTAKKMFSTEATISRQVKNLEEQLGIKLFEKIGKTLKITKDGERLYRLAIPKIKDMQNLFMEFQNEKNKDEQKTLNIATNPVIFKKILPFLHKFSCGFTNIKINISFLEQEKALKKLLDNEIDIFISSKENYENIKYGLSFVKMIDYIPYWVLYKNHPLANKKQLLKEDIIKSDLLFNEESITMPTFKSFILDNNLKSFISINNSDIDLWKILIKYEYGIALIFNTFLSKDDCSNFVLKNAENLFPKGEYGYYIKTINHKNVLKDFCNILDQNVKDLFFV